jgi:sugar/nucleoside kinase (ribokinase family)
VVLAAVGDLLEDVVVHPTTAINRAADTDAHIVRRRGGSAANVVAAAAQGGWPARFLGQVGADRTGDGLVDELATVGVDVTHVRRGGTTGAIVVLVDERGERTMLSDRGACIGLDRPARAWLHGVSVIHTPLYSLAEPPLADTTLTLLEWCRSAGIDVSIDLSSTTTIDALGTDRVRELLVEARPAVVLANADEAAHLGVDRPLATTITVVKHGGAPAQLFHPGGRTAVPAEPLGDVADSTGAGDAFAAGVLTADYRRDPEAACRAGHRAAAQALRSQAPTVGL